jgi:hypothetical protein
MWGIVTNSRVTESDEKQIYTYGIHPYKENAASDFLSSESLGGIYLSELSSVY